MDDNVSIFSVAKLAQCSIATVSNVLNNKGRVGDKTREAVLEAVKKLGYRTNSAGRNLRRRQTEILGLLFYPSCAQVFRNPFYAEVMEGLEEGLLNSGYHLLLAGYEASVRESSLPEFLERGKVDGLILLGRFPNEVIRKFSNSEKPLLLLDSNFEGPVDSVVSDGFAAEVCAVDLLVKNGHKEILMLAYNHEDYNIDQRVQGFIAGLKKNGINGGRSKVIRSAISHDEIYKLVRERLNSATPPTAIIAINDTMALAIMEKLAQDHIRVPETVSILGYDDDAVSAMAAPPLATIRVDKKKLGQTGAELILKRVSDPNRPVTKLAMPTELIVRNSVARIASPAR